MYLKRIGTILLGLVLVAAITPLTQFLTIGLINSDMETGSPAGWVVGVVFSLALLSAACRAIARFRLVSRESLVLLYCMFSVAVPMMNMGMPRGLFNALKAVQEHFVNFGINTYRTAYEAQSPDWFPIAPTTRGLAWNKADRLLRILQDIPVLKQREAARRDIMLAASLAAKRIERGETVAPAQGAARAALTNALARLGVDESRAILDGAQATGAATNALRTALQVLGLYDALVARQAQSHAASAAAAERLTAALAAVDEEEAGYAPVHWRDLAERDRARLERDRARLSDEERADLDRRIQALATTFAGLRADANRLSMADFARVRARRAEVHMAAFAVLDRAKLSRIRTSFVFRSTSQERKAISSQDGTDGTPNQNVAGLAASYRTRTSVGTLSTRDRLRDVVRGLPWGLWLVPALHWGTLVTCIFLFFTCLAEWLRRKWVERENLAFPLVEVADNLIRHDAMLETAEDVTAPAARRGAFASLFWVGFAIGALLLTMEAVGAYHIAAQSRVISFDVSSMVFTSGLMRSIGNVFFILSPIAVGLFFLVSLEVSLSVWVIYFVYRLIVAIVKQGADVRDSVYTGWGGGMLFPFEGEQLLGACLCVAAVSLGKTWRTMAREKRSATVMGQAYVPRRLNTAGLVVLPVVIGWLLWDMGVRNLPFMLFFSLVAMALAIAGARVRAETGLPTQHVTYEFTKLPLVLGLTGFTGAKVYTSFISVAFLPVSLLFRLLPQQLENIELARRNRVRYGWVAAASVLSFLVALAVGMVGFLVMAYWKGSVAYGVGDGLGGKPADAVFAYPIWVAHFLGENGLDNFTQVHWVRVWAIVAGAAVFGGLLLLRQRAVKFPLHPIGYLLVLLSTYFPWVQPYFKTAATSPAEVESSWLWGSAFVAWLAKKLIIKYGGMNTYRRAKPLFIGLVVGAVFCVFAWNMVDLVVSLRVEGLPPGVQPSDFMKTFVDRPAFSPRAY